MRPLGAETPVPYRPARAVDEIQSKRDRGSQITTLLSESKHNVLLQCECRISHHRFVDRRHAGHCRYVLASGSHSPISGAPMKKVLFLAVVMCPLAGSAQHFVTGVQVSIAPPALRLEVVPQPPSPRYQWIAGYCAWRRGKPAWMEGHWTMPPTPGYVCQPASWENRGGVWF